MAIFPQLLQDITTIKQHTIGKLSKLKSVNKYLAFRGPCIVIYSYNKTNEM